MQVDNIINAYQIRKKCVAAKNNGEICGKDSVAATCACKLKSHIDQVQTLNEVVINARHEILAERRIEALRMVEEEKRDRDNNNHRIEFKIEYYHANGRTYAQTTEYMRGGGNMMSFDINVNRIPSEEDIAADDIRFVQIPNQQSQPKIKFSLLRNQASCPVCLNDYDANTEVSIGKCGHMLCGPCFDRLNKKSCPLCRCDF